MADSQVAQDCGSSIDAASELRPAEPQRAIDNRFAGTMQLPGTTQEVQRRQRRLHVPAQFGETGAALAGKSRGSTVLAAHREHCLRPAGHAQLSVDVLQMKLDRLLADVEILSQFAVRTACAKPLEDTKFAGGQWLC